MPLVPPGLAVQAGPPVNKAGFSSQPARTWPEAEGPEIGRTTFLANQIQPYAQA